MHSYSHKEIKTCELVPHGCKKKHCAKHTSCSTRMYWVSDILCIDRAVLGNAGRYEWNISQWKWFLYGAELPHTIASSSSEGPSVSRPPLIGRPGTRASSLKLALHPTPRSYALVNQILLLNDMNEAQDCLNTCVPSLSFKSEWFPVVLHIHSNTGTCPDLY